MPKQEALRRSELSLGLLKIIFTSIVPSHHKAVADMACLTASRRGALLSYRATQSQVKLLPCESKNIQIYIFGIILKLSQALLKNITVPTGSNPRYEEWISQRSCHHR